jgi:hypothetical protein
MRGLRLARANGLLIAYFLRKGQWQQLSTRRISLPAKIAIGASVDPPDTDPFAGHLPARQPATRGLIGQRARCVPQVSSAHSR